MATVPDLVEDALVTRLAAIPGIVEVLDHEPQNLPRGRFPLITLLFTGARYSHNELGPMSELVWSWSVRLYIRLTDYREAQQALKDLVPAIISVTRLDPTLGGACFDSELQDEADEPTFAHDEGWLLKSLSFSASTDENA